jgi:exonuclease III
MMSNKISDINNNKRQRRMYKEIRSDNKLVKIAIINANGLNEVLKQQCISTIIEEEKITIMGISDTKFNNRVWNKTMNTKKYKAIWGSTNEQAGGVGIIIERE